MFIKSKVCCMFIYKKWVCCMFIYKKYFPTVYIVAQNVLGPSNVNPKWLLIAVFIVFWTKFLKLLWRSKYLNQVFVRVSRNNMISLIIETTHKESKHVPRRQASARPHLRYYTTCLILLSLHNLTEKFKILTLKFKF